MFTVTDLTGKVYELQDCTEDDIPGHFSRVEHWIEEEFKEEYKERMRACIAQGTAYKLDDDSCYLYFMKTRRSFSEAVCLNGYGRPMSVIALISGIFRLIERDIFFMEFVMHKGKTLKEYKSMLSDTSIRSFQKNDDVLLVQIQPLLKKWSKYVTNHRNYHG
jgi:hypothetical protein